MIEGPCPGCEDCETPKRCPTCGSDDPATKMGGPWGLWHDPCFDSFHGPAQEPVSEERIRGALPEGDPYVDDPRMDWGQGEWYEETQRLERALTHERERAERAERELRRANIYLDGMKAQHESSSQNIERLLRERDTALDRERRLREALERIANTKGLNYRKVARSVLNDTSGRP